MDDGGEGQGKRLEFGRRAGRAPTPPAAPAPRRHVPMDDVLAKMAGKIGERRRAAEASRTGAARDELEAGEGA